MTESEPFSSILLPSWELDDPLYFQKSLELYGERVLPPQGSDEAALEYLRQIFDLKEILDAAKDPDWGQSFPPVHRIDPGRLYAPASAWDELSSPRYRKWKLPYSQKNELLFPSYTVGLIPRYFFYDQEKKRLIEDGTLLTSFYEYFHGLNTEADADERMRYIGHIILINQAKARRTYDAFRRRLLQMPAAEIIVPGKEKQKMPSALLPLLRSFLVFAAKEDFMDLKDQPPAAYIIRLFNTLEEYPLLGNDRYLYCNQVARIPIIDTQEPFHVLFEKLRSLTEI